MSFIAKPVKHYFRATWVIVSNPLHTTKLEGCIIVLASFFKLDLIGIISNNLSEKFLTVSVEAVSVFMVFQQLFMYAVSYLYRRKLTLTHHTFVLMTAHSKPQFVTLGQQCVLE